MNTRTDLIAKYRPEAALIYRKQGVVTQEQFLSEATRLATDLPADKLLINYCRDRYYFMLAFAAALIRGSTSLLLPNRQSGTLDETLKEYPDSLCVLDHNDLPNNDCFDLRTDYAEMKPVVTSLQVPQIEDSLVAVVALTSGSTGKPKASKKLWRTLSGTARLLARRFATSDASFCITSTVPSQHMYGLEMTVLMALQAECSLNDAHPFFPEDVIDSLALTPEPRMLVSTPVHLRVLDDCGISFCRTSKIISATAPLATELAVQSERSFYGELEEIYGFTEAGSVATRQTSKSLVWQLLDDMSFESTEDSVYIRGSHLACDEKVSDVLEILEDGKFRLLGRAEDMLNIAGKRSSLTELNQKLLALRDIEDGIVFLLDSRTDMRPVALVVSNREIHDIHRELALSIDPVFLPRPLKKVPQLPRNATGKMPLNLLRQFWSEQT